MLLTSLFWARAHGGATHFPIALVFASAFMDALGFYWHNSPRKRQLSAAGYLLIVLSAFGCLGAVATGLALSQWQIGGTGLTLRHHLVVWPAFALIVGLGTWRCLVGNRPSRRGFRIYLVVVLIACALIGLAGFFGGEMLLGRSSR
jgi:uncharacterized membrane protein